MKNKNRNIRISFIINSLKQSAVSAAKLATRIVDEFDGIEYVQINGTTENGQSDFVHNNNNYVGIDFVLVFGGDGTMLRSCALTAGTGIPLIGINSGNLGFLTEVEGKEDTENELRDLFQKLIKGNYSIDTRPYFEISVNNKQYLALNDISILRFPDARLCDLEVTVNDDLVDNYRADGFIVSTPTGSTAYSLSAGGPIVSPKLQAMVLAPICSHSLRNRPVVVSDNEIVKIKCSSEHAGISIDGVKIFEQGFDSKSKNTLYSNFKASELEIRIRKSDQVAKFVKISKVSFYQKLLCKLESWSK